MIFGILWRRLNFEKITLEGGRSCDGPLNQGLKTAVIRKSRVWILSDGRKVVRILSNKMILGAGLVILVLLGAGFTLGIYSLKTMREVVSDQFNKQQLVLAEQAARQIEDQLKIVIQELSVLNQSPVVQHLEQGRWSSRIKITQAVVRKLGVIEIGRVDAGGNTVYSVDLNEQARISSPGSTAPEGSAFLGGPSGEPGENQGNQRAPFRRTLTGTTPADAGPAGLPGYGQ